MKSKRETCKYCGGRMEAKTTRQEFCSDKCRVYSAREDKADKRLKTALETDVEMTEIIEEINNIKPPLSFMELMTFAKGGATPREVEYEINRNTKLSPAQKSSIRSKIQLPSPTTKTSDI